MKAVSISTFSLFNAARSAIARNQSRLADIGVEVSTGRHADVGRSLGIETARDLDMRGSIADLESLQASNGIVATRLGQTQTALTAIADLADGFMQTVMTASQASGNGELLKSDAKSRLASLGELLSTTSNGAFVFGGTNVSTPPLNDYFAVPSTAGKAAVDGAFTATFGIAPSDPGVAGITAPQMKSYLDGAFASLFQDPGWQSNFSNANDSAMIDRVSLGETVETSSSANIKGVRDFVMALTAAIDSGGSQLNAEAFAELTKKLTQVTGTVAGNVASAQAELGISQERLAKANDRMVMQQSYLERRIGEIESVDIAKASIDLNTVSTQLQASYAVTTRIHDMSLLNYLPIK
jgi:flagellar hook-associated protein 3 FlgL